MRRHACRQRGTAIVEFALLLPLLLLIIFGIFDFARAIQANNILINLSREGANLVARTTSNPQYIMQAVADTAGPLDMRAGGSMVITRVMGRSDGRADVIEQYRWTNGQVRASRFWAGCPVWNAGSCTVPPPRPVITLPAALVRDESVYIVEAFYHYDAVFGFAMQIDPDLYDYTIL